MIPKLRFNNKIQRQQLAFTGLNKRDLIKVNELSDGLNLSTQYLPKLSNRKPRYIFNQTISNCNGYIRTDNHTFYIDGTNFYMDGVLKGTISQDKKQQLIDFNDHVIIFPDKKSYCYNPDNTNYDVFESFIISDDEVTDLEFDYAYPYNNRLFVCKGSDVRASKLGDFKTWNKFDGDNLDSWAADVYSSGNFTGIYLYQQHLIVFKENIMYELYGNLPSNFTLQKVYEIGCIDNQSIAEVDGKLIFLSEDGIYQYTGGVPRNISLNLGEINPISGVSKGDNRYYYISLTTDKETKFYRYDTYLSQWIIEDGLNIQFIDKLNNSIHTIDNTGSIIELDSELVNSEGADLSENGTKIPIAWEAYTKQFDYNLFNKKSIKKIKLKADMEVNSELEVYVRFNQSDWILVKSMKETPEKRHKRDMLINIPIRRCEYFQVKITGRGKSLIYGEIEFALGSEK